VRGHIEGVTRVQQEVRQMITKIGLFHFVENYDQPICSLRGALSECSKDVRDSLIVLPEAFNYGRSYSQDPYKESKLTQVEAANELAVLSRDHGVTFVVGLLDPPRNSAYLVRGLGEPVLMRHKRTEDSTNTGGACHPKWWRPCEADYGSNPYICEGACIGVLICNEMDCCASASWLAQELDQRAGTMRKVICIPAHMANGHLEGPSGFAPWLGKYVVFANSRKWPDGSRSFIANRSGQWAPEPGQLGRFVLKTWDELDSLSK